jgi:hypothetical protein
VAIALYQSIYVSQFVPVNLYRSLNDGCCNMGALDNITLDNVLLHVAARATDPG